MECLLISGMQRLLALFQRPETGKNNRKSLWLLSLQLGGDEKEFCGSTELPSFLRSSIWTEYIFSVATVEHFVEEWYVQNAKQRYGRKKNRTGRTVNIKFRAASHFQKERFPLFLHHIFHKLKSTSFEKEG
jgi:hypothetical protein